MLNMIYEIPLVQLTHTMAALVLANPVPGAVGGPRLLLYSFDADEISSRCVF
jgi:hypothetical protein